MSSADKGKLRIADPFEEDNDQMLQRLIDEAFVGISHGKNQINLMQAGAGLEFIFKRLQPVVPLPAREWYSAVFRNYDTDRDGEIDREAFEDIVQQYHAHHFEKVIRRSKRHSHPQPTQPAETSPNLPGNEHTSSNRWRRNKRISHAWEATAGNTPLSHFFSDSDVTFYNDKEVLQTRQMRPGAAARATSEPAAGCSDEPRCCSPASLSSRARKMCSGNSLRCSSCGTPLVQLRAEAAESNLTSSHSSTQRGNSGRRSWSLRLPRFKRLGLSISPLEWSDQQLQQQKHHHHHRRRKSAGPLEVDNVFGSRAVHEFLCDYSPWADVSRATGYPYRSSSRCMWGMECCSASLPSYQPLFVTLESLGAPLNATSSPSRLTSRSSTKDRNLDSSAAAPGEDAHEGDIDGNGGYSDSSEESIFIPRPRGKEDLHLLDMFRRSQSTAEVRSSVINSGLIEPKWPSSWQQAATRVEIPTSSQKRGLSMRRRAQETFHTIAVKLRRQSRKEDKKVGTKAWVGHSEDQQRVLQTTLDSNDASQRIADSSGKGKLPDSCRTSQQKPLETKSLTQREPLIQPQPLTQPQPELDMSFRVSAASSPMEKESSSEAPPAVATEPSLQEEEKECSSCCWLFYCCSPEVPEDSVHNDTINAIRETRRATSHGERKKGKRQPGGKRERN